VKDLEDRQREMRKRNSKRIKKPTPLTSDIGAVAAKSEVVGLEKRIADLERRLIALEAENAELRAQKTIGLGRSPQRSQGESVKEQQHNFFKYSNVHRY
jgi:hypothetical protein